MAIANVLEPPGEEQAVEEDLFDAPIPEEEVVAEKSPLEIAPTKPQEEEEDLFEVSSPQENEEQARRQSQMIELQGDWVTPAKNLQQHIMEEEARSQSLPEIHFNNLVLRLSRRGYNMLSILPFITDEEDQQRYADEIVNIGKYLDAFGTAAPSTAFGDLIFDAASTLAGGVFSSLGKLIFSNASKTAAKNTKAIKSTVDKVLDYTKSTANVSALGGIQAFTQSPTVEQQEEEFKTGLLYGALFKGGEDLARTVLPKYLPTLGKDITEFLPDGPMKDFLKPPEKIVMPNRDEFETPRRRDPELGGQLVDKRGIIADDLSSELEKLGVNVDQVPGWLRQEVRGMISPDPTQTARYIQAKMTDQPILKSDITQRSSDMAFEEQAIDQYRNIGVDPIPELDKLDTIRGDKAKARRKQLEQEANAIAQLGGNPTAEAGKKLKEVSRNTLRHGRREKDMMYDAHALEEQRLSNTVGEIPINTENLKNRWLENINPQGLDPKATYGREFRELEEVKGLPEEMAKYGLLDDNETFNIVEKQRKSDIDSNLLDYKRSILTGRKTKADVREEVQAAKAVAKKQEKEIKGGIKDLREKQRNEKKDATLAQAENLKSLRQQQKNLGTKPKEISEILSEQILRYKRKMRAMDRRHQEEIRKENNFLKKAEDKKEEVVKNIQTDFKDNHSMDPLKLNMLMEEKRQALIKEYAEELKTPLSLNNLRHFREFLNSKINNSKGPEKDALLKLKSALDNEADDTYKTLQESGVETDILDVELKARDLNKEYKALAREGGIVQKLTGIVDTKGTPLTEAENVLELLVGKGDAQIGNLRSFYQAIDKYPNEKKRKQAKDVLAATTLLDIIEKSFTTKTRVETTEGRAGAEEFVPAWDKVGYQNARKNLGQSSQELIFADYPKTKRALNQFDRIADKESIDISQLPLPPMERRRLKEAVIRGLGMFGYDYGGYTLAKTSEATTRATLAAKNIIRLQDRIKEHVKAHPETANNWRYLKKKYPHSLAVILGGDTFNLLDKVISPQLIRDVVEGEE